MVYKRSEYGHEFKVSSLQKNIPVYKENLTYRHSRRDREFAHTPIAWGDEIAQDSDSDEKLSPEEQLNEVPVSKLAITSIDEAEESESDEDDIAREKKEAFKKDKRNQELVCESPEKDVEIMKQSEKLGKQARAKLNKFVTKEMSENLDQPAEVKKASEKKSLGKTYSKPQAADERLFAKSSKPRRPDRQNRIPAARSQSRPQSAPAHKKTGAKETKMVPFVAYGCGDVECSLGQQKTFNIRASSAVYPAALRAQRRNLLAIEKRVEKERTASAREKKKKDLFNEKMTRETLSWVSEYRRSFPIYEDTQYCTTDRDPRKQKSYFTT